MDYWDPTYEDSLDLLAKLPEIGAYIYNKQYRFAFDQLLSWFDNRGRSKGCRPEEPRRHCCGEGEPGCGKYQYSGARASPTIFPFFQRRFL